MTGESELLRRLLASEVKGELLLLFHKNPGLIDTLDGVARRIGRTANTIEADAGDLLNLGILKTKRVGQSEVVFLNLARDKEIQEVLVRHLQGSPIGRSG